MIVPTKHEKLNKNILVIGANIISILKNNRMDIEALFNKLKKNIEIDLDHFYNTITFLWLIGAVKKEGYFISISK